MKNQNLIPSVNFHLWEPCNFRCKFCFATFQDVKKTILPKGHLPKEDTFRLIDALSDAGFSKITFAGGEPTLCPWIDELIIKAKTKGLTVMIVTNGIGIDDAFLSVVSGYLDWVVISIDSIVPEINKQIGRHQGQSILPDYNYYDRKIKLVRKHGIKLKINSVVNEKNYHDISLPSFIQEVKPARWKIFQALKVVGQNDASFNEVAISDDKFQLFIESNSIKQIPYAVIEDNKAMTGTYIMIDPAGRFFDNTKGYYTYSQPILKNGVKNALREISFSYSDFVKREGVYDWE